MIKHISIPDIPDRIIYMEDGRLSSLSIEMQA